MRSKLLAGSIAATGRGLKLVGFVDQHWAGEDEFRQSGYEVVSDFAGFQDFLKDHVVDEVVICTPLKSLYDISARIFAQCEQQGITVRFRLDPFSPSIGRSWIDEFEGQPVLTVNSTPPQRFSLYVKRIVDAVGSAALLLSLSPLMLLIALAIKRTSDGPVFFTQERVGSQQATISPGRQCAPFRRTTSTPASRSAASAPGLSAFEAIVATIRVARALGLFPCAIRPRLPPV